MQVEKSDKTDIDVKAMKEPSMQEASQRAGGR
jgi:hypothetical protein